MLLKKLIILILVGLVLFFSWRILNQKKYQSYKKTTDHKVIEIKKTNSPTAKPTTTKTVINKQSIFVPYWQLNDKLGNYDRYFYFGITADDQGIDQQEIGYQKLERFLELTEGKKRFVVLRLVDNQFNQILLKDKVLQEKIIDQTLTLVKEKKLDGLVLDLELFTVFDINIKDKINNFVKNFYTLFFDNYKIFSLLIYGDVFYRHRPYDLAFINQFSDEILIMAYDFSKTTGEPGPNFPFNSGLYYNYSFKKMIEDYLRLVPPEKITVVFGMYGYEWIVDEKKRPIAQAKALTINQIKDRFCLNKDIFDDQFQCCQKSCLIKRDKESAEVEINYVLSANQPDDQGIYRLDYYIVWTEDQRSVETKTNFLEEKGINSIAYWAWGYF